MRARSARRAAKRMVAPTTSFDPFDEIEVREDVHRMLLELAPRQRAALLLLDLYGYGSEEAAKIMGIRPSTVRALATQGRAVLRTTGGSDG
jgi:RNA polymerase sigma-70 factor (ECF subfamily)